ncbi:MAG: hypothetical protein HY361_05240 [Candidatus Aenigmarchaeota archaeon]|nr:hypothetical protein [Candidatus Aenigmarchaeota archaeon]
MVLLELAVIVLTILLVYFVIKDLRWRYKFEQKIKEWLDKEEKRIRQDAIQRSARVLSGKTLEKFVPFLDRFTYNPHDVRWLGDPIDLVIFDGYSDNGNIRQIVFCEIKSGNSKLSNIQRKIKELVEQKQIKWVEFKF